MAVKLDVLVNYLFDNSKLKANIASLNKQMIATWSPFTGFTNKSLLSSQALNLRERFSRINFAARQFNSIMENTLQTVKEMNKEGLFADYLKSMGLRRKKLKPEEEKALARSETSQQMSELQALQQMKERSYEENSENMIKLTKDLYKADEKARKKLAKLQEKYADDKHQADLDEIEEKSKEEAEIEKQRQKDIANAQIRYQRRAIEGGNYKTERFFNLLLGRWGKLGLWGIAATKAVSVIEKVISSAIQTSMQGLDWRRTIEGGAAGGTSFGQGVAAYQRAGIGATSYQNFRRGIQGYMGSVKLGMGNAAPLMYLGISALDKLDDTEKQIEMALRRIGDESASLALAQQMGLSYEMWHAIYTGKLDRERSAYSEEAIQKWAAVADRLNDLITSLKVFLFEKSSGFAYNITHPEKALSRMSFPDYIGAFTGLSNPATFFPTLIRFGQVEVVVKNEQGEVLGKGESYADVGMQVPRQGS